MKKSILPLVIGTFTLTGAAYAQNDLGDRTASGSHTGQNQDTPHLYVGGSYGFFKSSGGDFDDEEDLLEVNVGGFFNPYVGLEGSATFFGEYGGDIASADAHGYGLAAVGRLPLSESWGIYGKAGQFFWEVDVDSALGSEELDGNDPFLGAGTDFRLTDNLRLTVEYARYLIETEWEELPETDDSDLDTLKVGVRFTF